MLSSEERGNAWTDMYTAALYIDADWNVDGEDHYYAGVTERLRTDHEALAAERDELKAEIRDHLIGFGILELKLEGERDEWKRIAEWLASKCESVEAYHTVQPTWDTAADYLQAAREAVNSPATTTTKEAE